MLLPEIYEVLVGREPFSDITDKKIKSVGIGMPTYRDQGNRHLDFDLDTP